MNKTVHNSPLADRIRPESLNDFLGQEKIVGKNSLLYQAIKENKIPSMIFWGPPGSGKTTLALIIAKQSSARFRRISAVAGGLKELKEIIQEAKESKRLGEKTILFIDEIHRWNKIQQDALLPHIEQGTITLIGATTENPGFEIRKALLSRCRVFILEKLKIKDIEKILQRALQDKIKGLGFKKMKIKKEYLTMIARLSDGDARTALNILDYLSFLGKKIDENLIKEAFQKTSLFYDKNGEEHYNIISALHKSMRGGDENASLYWLARMLENGEDPLYIARRMIRFASEDIGLKNSHALEQMVAVYQACQFIGMPECNVVLAQGVVYLAKCQKSNKLYTAYNKAKQDIENFGNLPVPLHLRNAPTDLMKKLNYGKGYKYSPDYDYKEDQDYFPEELKNHKYI